MLPQGYEWCEVCLKAHPRSKMFSCEDYPECAADKRYVCEDCVRKIAEAAEGMHYASH